MNENLDQVTGLEFGNFNPENMESDEIINVVLCIDTSSSMYDKKDELNEAYREFVEYFKGTHIAEKLFISRIEFNDTVHKHTGFQPVTALGDIDFSGSIAGCTALYDAAKEGLQNAVKYREDCENNGISVKTIFFQITDGQDNRSNSSSASEVKSMMESIRREEQNIGSFTTILLGLGEPRYFEEAHRVMGFDHLAVAGDTGADIRKMIGFISASISSVSSGQGIPNF